MVIVQSYLFESVIFPVEQILSEVECTKPRTRWFKGNDGNIDFINQTGDMKLDMNAEMRTFCFGNLTGLYLLMRAIYGHYVIMPTSREDSLNGILSTNRLPLLMV